MLAMLKPHGILNILKYANKIQLMRNRQALVRKKEALLQKKTNLTIRRHKSFYTATL